MLDDADVPGVIATQHDDPPGASARQAMVRSSAGRDLPIRWLVGRCQVITKCLAVGFSGGETPAAGCCQAGYGNVIAVIPQVPSLEERPNGESQN
jgi:hypothetical protein